MKSSHKNTANEMGVFDKCCCCIDLRVGCIVLAIWGMLSSSGAFIYAAKATDDSQAGVFITDGILGLIAYGTLLYGAVKYNSIATLVFLVLQMIGMILGVTVIILAFVAAGDALSDPIVKQVATIMGVSLIFSSALSIYFWLCIYSFYQKVKKGEIGPDSKA